MYLTILRSYEVLILVSAIDENESILQNLVEYDIGWHVKKRDVVIFAHQNSWNVSINFRKRSIRIQAFVQFSRILNLFT